MPESIITALQDLPCCWVQIHVRRDTVEEKLTPNPFLPLTTPDYLSALIRIAPCLKRLSLAVPASDLHGSRSQDVQESIAQLISKSQIRVLDVTAVTMLHIRCVQQLDPLKAIQAFEWLPGDAEGHCPLSLEEVRLRNFCLCDADLQTFQGVQRSVDWCSLKKASFSCWSFIRLLSIAQTQLRKLELTLDSDTNPIACCPKRP